VLVIYHINSGCTFAVGMPIYAENTVDAESMPEVYSGTFVSRLNKQRPCTCSCFVVMGFDGDRC